MTDAPQKTPKKKASRRFDAKDPVINDIYQQVMEKMFQDKTILKPFEYDFNETTDTHTLTYEDFLRFVKQDKNRRIDVYIKDQVGEWVDVNVSSDFQNGYQNGYITARNILENTSEQRVSPVMWPVLATNQSLIRNVHGPISRHMSAFFDKKKDQDFMVIDQILPPANPLEEKLSFNQKLHKLSFAMTLIWQGKTQKFRFANTKSGVAKWWDKFVDREALKMFVSVFGNSKHSHLTWIQMAFATQHPQLDQVIKKVKNMGGEKILLRSHPFEEWGNLTLKDLLDQSWVHVWDRVTTLPVTVQKAMAHAALPRNHVTPYFSPWDKRSEEEKNAEIARYVKAHQDYENMISELKSPASFYLFEEYQKISDKKKWSHRELDMLFKVSYNLANRLEHLSFHNPFFEDSLPSSQSKENWDNIIKQTSWMGDFVSSYRACYPTRFKKWSAGDQAHFVNISSLMLKSIVDPNDQGYYNKEEIAPVRAKMEEIALQRALGEKIKEKKKAEKKSVKKKRM